MDSEMAYRLSLVDDVPTAVRACAREQLEGAIARLEAAGEDPVEAVHDARKHLKKSRALLRLVRPALGRDAYRRENAALRDAGLALSGTRDADVLAETVEKLAARGAGRLPAATFEQLRAAVRASGEEPPDTTAVLEALREAAARVERWPLGSADWDSVIVGAARAYTRGQEAFDIARHEPTAVHLHEWRKRVKDLWYHERLLAPAWPELLKAHGEEAHALSELLGDDHDLTALRERIEQGLELPPEAAADRVELVALIDERRAELREQAVRLGRRLYAEPPKAFRRRLACYVRAAVEEQRQA
jgi:CHAD domain-containing protein